MGGELKGKSHRSSQDSGLSRESSDARKREKGEKISATALGRARPSRARGELDIRHSRGLLRGSSEQVTKSESQGEGEPKLQRTWNECGLWGQRDHLRFGK